MTWGISFDEILVSLDCCITGLWHPIYKNSVFKDENNNAVDNHGLPMSCVLEMSIFGVKRERRVDQDMLSETTVNMDGKWIINVAYPQDPVENIAYNGDVVTAKALSDFRKYSLGEVLLRYSDNVMNGRLDMSGHKIK